MDNKELIKLAFDTREYAYTPYSHWKVGAALLCKDGTVYKGCNIENNTFTPTICAERTAFFKAISEGRYDFEKIVVVGGDERNGVIDYCEPCGVCRQVMMEFCNPEKFKIICAKSCDDYKEFTLKEIMPHSKHLDVADNYKK